MNLLVNKLITLKTGLAISLALFLFSCTDPSEIGGDLDPNLSRTELRIVEIPVESSVVLLDSLFSFNTGRLLIGRQSDPNFGKTYNESYTEIRTVTKNPNIPGDVVFDSLVLSLRIGKTKYIHGTDISSPQTINIYQLSDTLPYVVGNLYAFQKKEYNSNDLWGQKTTTLHQDTDTIINIRLKNEVGAQWLSSAINKDGTFASDSAFVTSVKGIALVPGDNNSFVFGVDPAHADSKIRLHYHSASDTTSLVFTFASLYQNYIEADRTGTPLEGLTVTDELMTDQYIYAQAGTGVVSRLKFDSYKNFLDTAGDISITKADIEIGGIVKSNDNKTHPSAISLFYTDSLFNLIKSVNPQTGYQHFFAPFNETSSTPLTLYYSNTFNFYKNEVTTQFISLRKASDKLFFSTIILPGDASAEVIQSSSIRLRNFANNLDQLIIPKNQIKLKLYYTKIK